LATNEVIMQPNLVFGGVLRRSLAPAAMRDATDPFAVDVAWRAGCTESDLFLEAIGDAFAIAIEDDLALVIRGVATLDDAVEPGRIFAAIRDEYRARGTLPVDRLEGSFSIMLLDGSAGRALLYRNLVGNQFTYYTVTPDGLLFGSNLAALVERGGIPRRPARDMLPIYFLFRFVPGRHTLFDRVYRLLPGELVTFDARGLRREHRQTFAGLRRAVAAGSDTVGQIEATMQQVLTNWGTVRPHTATLLSGGVDSSYLQAVWNRVRPAADEPPSSFAVGVNHRLTQIDAAYALSAAAALGTRHTQVPADGAYASYLIDTLAATGEPPNHAMTVYFGHLARTMTTAGVPAGLCGEGADSLFGMGLADTLQTARWLRRLVPHAWLRRFGGALAALAGREHLPEAFRVADFVHDPEDWEHPFNRAAIFADWDAVQACFGEDGVAGALAYRRGLLAPYDVGADPREQLHGIGYLGEAADSASLWTTLFHHAGGELCCPYLDSRLLGLAVSLPPHRRFPYCRPKELLKQALARHVPRELAYRFKLGFGQPVFEWLAPGGQLRPYAERIGAYDFVPAAVRAAALARPGWFLYSLLCYDLWHKLFIDRSLTHRGAAPGRRRQPVVRVG
jgi:asparagine synthase (glutamine-hydrolysing)